MMETLLKKMQQKIFNVIRIISHLYFSVKISIKM